MKAATPFSWPRHVPGLTLFPAPTLFPGPTFFPALCVLRRVLRARHGPHPQTPNFSQKRSRCLITTMPKSIPKHLPSHPPKIVDCHRNHPATIPQPCQTIRKAYPNRLSAIPATSQICPERNQADTQPTTKHIAILASDLKVI